MLPPTLRYGNVPPARRFCNVPGDTPSSLRTSALFSHSLSKLSFALLPMICLNFSSISRLNCRRSSRVMMSISISLSLYFHIRISRYRDIDSRRLHGARYTAKYTETLRWCYPSALGYPRRIPETPMAIAWGQASRAMPNFRLLHSHRGMAIWRNVRTARFGPATKRGDIRCSHRAAPPPLGQSWGIKQGYG